MMVLKDTHHGSDFLVFYLNSVSVSHGIQLCISCFFIVLPASELGMKHISFGPPSNPAQGKLYLHRWVFRPSTKQSVISVALWSYCFPVEFLYILSSFSELLSIPLVYCSWACTILLYYSRLNTYQKIFLFFFFLCFITCDCVSAWISTSFFCPPVLVEHMIELSWFHRILRSYPEPKYS